MNFTKTHFLTVLGVLGLALITSAILLNSWVAFSLFTVSLAGYLFVYALDRVRPAPTEVLDGEDLLAMIERQQDEIRGLSARFTSAANRVPLGRS